MEEKKRIRKPVGIAQIVAWVIFIAWAGFWTYFSVGSGVAEIGEYGMGSFYGHMMMPVGIVVLFLLTLLNRIAGGLLLIAAAVFSYVFFNAAGDVLKVLVLVLPQMLAGALFIAAGVMRMSAKKPPEAV